MYAPRWSILRQRDCRETCHPISEKYIQTHDLTGRHRQGQFAVVIEIGDGIRLRERF